MSREVRLTIAEERVVIQKHRNIRRQMSVIVSGEVSKSKVRVVALEMTCCCCCVVVLRLRSCWDGQLI